MTKQYEISKQAAALQKKIDDNLANQLRRNQALRDRLDNLSAKAAALAAKECSK